MLTTTSCVRDAQSLENHLYRLPPILADANFNRSALCQTLFKAFCISQNTAPVEYPASTTDITWLTTRKSCNGVASLSHYQKPDWYFERSMFPVRCSVRGLLMIFSNTLVMIGSSEIGRQISGQDGKTSFEDGFSPVMFQTLLQTLNFFKNN